ncbi:MAG: hypothetical protein WC975_00775 [Phycisphaerae bacterium]
MRKLLVIAGILIFAMPAFAWVDTFNYDNVTAMSANWSGTYDLVLDPQQGDGNMARVINAGSLIGLQTGPSTDWYVDVQAPNSLGNYQGFGIFNVDKSKQIYFLFDQGGTYPVRVQLNTGTWALNYWETWYGSGDASAYVTGIAGLWHFHSDANGTYVEQNGQVVFSRPGYSFIDDSAMHFEFGTHYGGTPVDFNYVGTQWVGKPLQGTIILDDYGDPQNPDYSNIGARIDLRQGETTKFSQILLLNDNGSFSVSAPSGTYDVAIKACSWLETVVDNVTIGGALGGTVGTVHLTNGDLDGSNEVSSTDLSIVLSQMNTMGDQ